MTEESDSGRGKQRGHMEGQTNLEHITQHTLWDRTTVPHFPYSTPPVLMMSYYSGLSYITAQLWSDTPEISPMNVHQLVKIPSEPLWYLPSLDTVA